MDALGSSPEPSDADASPASSFESPMSTAKAAQEFVRRTATKQDADWEAENLSEDDEDVPRRLRFGGAGAEASCSDEEELPEQHAHHQQAQQQQQQQQQPAWRRSPVASPGSADSRGAAPAGERHQRASAKRVQFAVAAGRENRPPAAGQQQAQQGERAAFAADWEEAGAELEDSSPQPAGDQRQTLQEKLWRLHRESEALRRQIAEAPEGRQGQRTLRNLTLQLQAVKVESDLLLSLCNAQPGSSHGGGRRFGSPWRCAEEQAVGGGGGAVTTAAAGRRGDRGAAAAAAVGGAGGGAAAAAAAGDGNGSGAAAAAAVGGAGGGAAAAAAPRKEPQAISIAAWEPVLLHTELSVEDFVQQRCRVLRTGSRGCMALMLDNFGLLQMPYDAIYNIAEHQGMAHGLPGYLATTAEMQDPFPVHPAGAFMHHDCEVHISCCSSNLSGLLKLASHGRFGSNPSREPLTKLLNQLLTTNESGCREVLEGGEAALLGGMSRLHAIVFNGLQSGEERLALVVRPCNSKFGCDSKPMKAMRIKAMESADVQSLFWAQMAALDIDGPVKAARFYSTAAEAVKLSPELGPDVWANLAEQETIRFVIASFDFYGEDENGAPVWATR